jgi:hypothetical protein
MSFTLTFGQEGNCATAQVVWSVDGQTYNFRSDNNFVAWISTIFTVADVVAGGGGGVANPLVLPDNTNANGWSLNTLDNGGTGGSITMIGSSDGENQSSSGNINLSAGDPDGGNGGSIDLRGGNASRPGGSLTMKGGVGSAGSINTSGVTSGGDTYSGGSIDLRGQADGPGGSINLSNNGGDITSTGFGGYSGGDINTSASGDGSGGYINTSAGSAGGGSINTSNGGGSINTSNGGGSINLTGQGSIVFGILGESTTLAGSALTDQTITMPDASGTMAVILVGSDTIDFPNIPANSTATHDVTIVGVIAGEAVLVTCTDVRTGNDQRVIFSGFVASTPDTVTVLATNTSGAGINLPSLSFKIIVFRGL